MKFKRIFLVILDSLGIGATNDSDKYGDGLANTLKHTLEQENIKLPNLEFLGLFQLFDETDEKHYGYYTKAIPSTITKSSLISHLEMMGVNMNDEYKKLDINNLDKDLISLIYTEIGRKFIIAGNNEDVLNKYGELQIKSGDIIISYNYYTLKIYAHESVIPLKELSKIGTDIMNILLEQKFLINKIECNSFSGKTNEFKIKEVLNVPIIKPNETILETLKKNGFKILTIGKATEIFNHQDMTNICKTSNDIDNIKKLLKATSFNFTGVCICNLSDLNYHGHKRDVKEYAKKLKGFDNSIPLIVGSMHTDDLLIITSDQGNDPTYSGNDHTREKVPVLIFNTNFKKSEELPCLHTLADIGATIASNFGVEYKNGTSFLEKLK